MQEFNDQAEIPRKIKEVIFMEKLHQ